MKDLTDLEKEILLFINKQTWNEFHPKKVRLQKKGKIGRAKIRWMKIRYKKEWQGKTEKRFTESDIEFNKALNTLKAQKLITSRTKCQQFAGLTCTELGHNLSIKLYFNTLN